MIRDSCWYCKHFSIDTGQQDWSENTLGGDGHLRCWKNHFWLEFKSDVTEKEIYKTLAKARTCSDFEARDLSFLEES